MATERYDAIVIGCGGVGGATLFHLARRGARVLGIDRFTPPHHHGSSHGQTRIIRQAYFEHPDYVPLLRRAYELWRELEAESGCRLLHESGLLEIGPADGEVLTGVLAAAQKYGLEIERLDAGEIARRFPVFHVPDGLTGVFENRAGYLLVEDCVQTHLHLARRHGAQLQFGRPVIDWTVAGDGVCVAVDGDTFRAAALVIAAGPWAGRMLRRHGIKFTVLKKHVHWYENSDPRYCAGGGCPTFLFELPAGVFYGFPQLDDRGVKVAEHSGGTPVDEPPATDHGIDPAERGRVETFLRAHLPGVTGDATDHSTCFYTMSRDGHFVVDRDPDHRRVSFAAGLSGHGFKFAGVLGEVLADWALGQETNLPIGFLASDRPALRDLTPPCTASKISPKLQ